MSSAPGAIIPDLLRLGQEVGLLPGIKPGLPDLALVEEGPASAFKGPVQNGQELARFFGENSGDAVAGLPQYLVLGRDVRRKDHCV